MDNAFHNQNGILEILLHLILYTACSIISHGKNTVAQWFKNNSDSETNSESHEEVQEKLKENLGGVLETDFVELSDLDEHSSDEEKVEDSYRSKCLVECSKETYAFFETEEKIISAKSGIYLQGKNDNHMNVGEVEEERRKVFSNYIPFRDDSFDLDSSELDSTFSLSKHEPGGHKSNKLLTKQTDTINDIVALFRTYEKPENVNESSKGHDDLKSKTTCSKETAVFLQCAYDVKNIEIKRKKERKSARRRSERRTQRSLRDIIIWQTSLRRNPTVVYDVRPGTTNGRTEFHQMAYSGRNEKSEDSRGVVNGFVAEAQPQTAVQSKSSIERDHLQASGVQETLEVPLEYQNGIVDNKSAQIVDNKSAQIVDDKSAQLVDNKSSQATEEENRENGASYYSLLQSASASSGFSLTTTETLSSYFDSVSLLSVGGNETFKFEWIRLTTFSDWPLKSIFSTTLARNGWVSLGKGDEARCYSCHIVHEGWRIGDDPDQYHIPNCRFKSGQSNNIPISRATSNQTPNPGRIARDQQQFPSPGNPLYSGNLSGGASSVGHPDRVQGLSEKELTRPNQDSLLAQESNLQPDWNFPRPRENYPQAYEMRKTTMTCNQTVTSSQQVPEDNHESTAAEGPISRCHEAQLEVGLPTSEILTVPTPRNTDSSGNTNTSRNTGTPTPQVPTDNLHSTAAAEGPLPHGKEAQLEALKKDPMGINFDFPKYPSYAFLAVRISSFTDWPADMTQTPRDMALAGFFYAGYGDYTRCFFCGGGLRNWEAGDDPWDEDGNNEEMENSQITTSTRDPRSTQAKEENVMRSAAVTAIKEMGYSEDKIKAAIHTIKSRLPREKHKVSVQEILEVIFELNQSESGSPVGQSERVSENSTNSTNQSDSTAENTAHHMSQSDPAPEGNLNSTNEDASAMDNFTAELTSLKQENSCLKDQILCKICMDEKVSIAFLPCGHLACCEDCAPAMRKCPICREFVRHYIEAILVLRS